MTSSNAEGTRFEDEVGIALETLEKQHPKRVTVLRQPRVELQNGETVIPDFDLRILQHHQRNYYFIECQNRKRSTKEILHKIQHVRNKQWRSTFIFLYPNEISPELSRSLRIEGVIHLAMAEFKVFLERMSEGLAMLPKKTNIDNVGVGDRCSAVQVMANTTLQRIVLR